MAYSTVSEVSSEFKKLTINANSSVTTTEAERFIAEADELIDAFVGKRYETPLTLASNPKSFKIVRQISIWIVAERIKNIMQIKEIGDDKLQQGGRPGDLEKKAMDRLKMIADGNLPLSDATVKGAGNLFDSYAVGQGLEHTFKKGTDQW